MNMKQIIRGFQITACQEIAELKAVLYQMEHISSGAKLIWLNRTDENKTFAIAFRTPPWDDTGVFHILEHSVLCGSQRYPMKRPFVELMKSSMKTFLNAMTFPDKTVYPVSSRNSKDFLNLVRVYMDAVLHPRIYSCPEIFSQEGWHYELNADGTLTYKGVVFNEMKGAFASPDTLLQNEICRCLFPDTCYHCVSGGDPAHIPDLTYRQFLDSHFQFYHPSNSYIFLDGQMNIEEVLSILDEEYLNAYSRVHTPPEIAFQPSVKCETVRTFYEISPNSSTERRAWLAMGYVLGDFNCRMEQIAMRALAEVLCGSCEAPLKQLLLSQGLAQDVQIIITDGILQPYVMLKIRDVAEDRLVEVESAVRSELQRLVDGALDHEQLSAALSNLEFQMRERDYGSMPQGIVLGLTTLESWLYGGEPADHLELGGVFTSLSRKLESGWFESLLEWVFIDNPHRCQVLLIPSPTLGAEKLAWETARLQAVQKSWSKAEKDTVLQKQETLRVWQSSGDKPEALATLPRLKLSDIPAQPDGLPLEECRLGGMPLLYHRISTGDISYVNLYFDISDFPQEALPQISFLCTLLGKLDTSVHGNAELRKLGRLLLGNLSFQVEAYGKINTPQDCRSFLCVSFSALDSNLNAAAALVAEIVTKTRFMNLPVLRNILHQSISALEQSVIDSGHSFAVTRISAGYSVEGVIRECVGGLTYCQWLKALESNFESKIDQLSRDFVMLCREIFVKNRLTISITGTNDSAIIGLESFFVSHLPLLMATKTPGTIRPWGKRNEGIIIPADVSFSALGGSLLKYNGTYSGNMLVLSRIVSLEYLWNAIRVQGGAYGTGAVLHDSGNMTFYSYRDPNARRSIICYRQIPKFIDQICSEKQDMVGYITGAVAELDPLMLPQRKGKLSDTFYLKGVGYADRYNIRKGILEASSGSLTELLSPLREVSRNGSICVIGSRQQITLCSKEINTIFTL